MARIDKLREYLFNVIDELTQDNKYQINADYLGDINDYSLDKIPTQSEERIFVDGSRRCRDVYDFRNRRPYSADTLSNLKNIGFFEEFEKKIYSNNFNGILPDIDGIVSIECLNCGTMDQANQSEAVFDIQIQIIYESEGI